MWSHSPTFYRPGVSLSGIGERGRTPLDVRGGRSLVLESGRSTVRSRPCPPCLRRSAACRSVNGRPSVLKQLRPLTALQLRHQSVALIGLERLLEPVIGSGS
jgi:hypothetical protein